MFADAMIFGRRVLDEPADQELEQGLVSHRVHSRRQLVDQLDVQPSVPLAVGISKLEHQVLFAGEVESGVFGELIEQALAVARIVARREFDRQAIDQRQEVAVLQVDFLDAGVVRCLPVQDGRTHCVAAGCCLARV